MTTITNNEILKGLLNEMPNKRKQKREVLIKNFFDFFLINAKKNGLLSFPRSSLNFLVEDLKTTEKTKERLISSIIKYLLDKRLMTIFSSARSL